MKHYLEFTDKTEFNQTFIEDYWRKLSIFLSVSFITCPIPILATTKKEWNSYYDEDDKSRAYYDEYKRQIVFWGESYKKENYFIIPTEDLLHELIHHIQYMSGNWNYNDVLEGSAELYTHILLGHHNRLEYLPETLKTF